MSVQVRFGDALLLGGTDGDGVLWTVSKLDGWGSPGSSGTWLQKPYGHGEWAATPGFLRGRSVSVSGFVVAPTVELAAAAEDRLFGAVSLGPTRLTVSWPGRGDRWAMVRREGDVLTEWVTDRAFEFSVQVRAKDPRKYADPVSASTGLPSASGGLAVPLAVVQRTNLITNGSLEYGSLAPWATYGSTGTRSLDLVTTDGVFGSSCARLTVSGISSDNGVQTYPSGLTVGTTYTLSAYLKVAGASPLSVRLRSSDGQIAVTVPADTQWHRYSITYTLTGPGFVRPAEFYVGGSTSGVILIDGIMLTEGGVLGDYFDGDTPYTQDKTYAWTGTAGQSTSTESTPAGLAVPVSITSDVASGQCFLTNPGDEVGPVRLRIAGVDDAQPLVGPVVTHVASGQSLVFSSSVTLGAGEWLDVDMEAQTVLAQGQAPRNGWVTRRGWSGFEPGVNTWAFTAQSGLGQLTVTATPAWK